MGEAFLIGGVRTPVGRYGGVLAGVRPDDLAALVVAEAVSRAGIDPELIDEVILGGANQAGEDNRNVARMSVLLAGLPDSVPGITVNRLCASGLSAITMAAQAIRAGDADIIVAGGVESMTRAPWVQAKPEKAFAKPGDQYDTSIGWRFPNPRLLARDKATYSMPETGEEVARVYGITREDADAFAYASHQKAIAAVDAGRFDAEIVGVDRCERHDSARRGSAPRHQPRGTRRAAPGRAGRVSRHCRQLERAERRRIGDRRSQWRRRGAIRSRAARASGGRGERGSRTRGHGHRSGAGNAEGPRARRAHGRRPRLGRAQRGVRDTVARGHPGTRHSTRLG